MLSPDGLVNEIHIDICDGYTHCDRICQFLQVPRDDRVCAPSCPRLFKSGWARAHPCPMASAPMIMAVYDFFCPYWSVVHDGERMVQKLKSAANIWQKWRFWLLVYQNRWSLSEPGGADVPQLMTLERVLRSLIADTRYQATVCFVISHAA